MFQSVGRILRWAKGYRRRMILGFVCSFFATWCTAGPVMLAAWALGRLIGNAWGENEISASLPWLCLVGITALILLRFLFTYWKNRLQESIGTERAADQRMELDEYEMARVDAELQRLQELLPGRPTASITYFVPDERKDGGSYQTVTGSVKRIDAVNGVIQMTDRQCIPIADVFSIEIIP